MVRNNHPRTSMLAGLLCWLGLSLAAPAGAAEAMIIVGVEEPPGSFSSARGEARGISVDYVQEIQRRIGNKDRIRIVPETEAMTLARTQPNVVAFSFSRTNEREEQFQWIGQVFRKPWVLYVRKDSTLKTTSVDEMRKIPRIGVTDGDVRATWLAKQGFTNLLPTATPSENIDNLRNGKVDAIFFEPQGMAFYCRQKQCADGELVSLYSPRSSDVYILMSKQTPAATVKQWKEAAAQIKSDGTYEKIARKWLAKSALDYGINSTFEDGLLIFR